MKNIAITISIIFLSLLVLTQIVAQTKEDCFVKYDKKYKYSSHSFIPCHVLSERIDYVNTTDHDWTYEQVYQAKEEGLVAIDSLVIEFDLLGLWSRTRLSRDTLIWDDGVLKFDNEPSNDLVLAEKPSYALILILLGGLTTFVFSRYKRFLQDSDLLAFSVIMGVLFVAIVGLLITSLTFVLLDLPKQWMLEVSIGHPILLATLWVFICIKLSIHQEKNSLQVLTTKEWLFYLGLNTVVSGMVGILLLFYALPTTSASDQTGLVSIESDIFIPVGASLVLTLAAVLRKGSHVSKTKTEQSDGRVNMHTYVRA